MTTDVLIQEHNNSITTLTLNLPSKANALDVDLCHALTSAINALNQNQHTKVIILAATGKVFSAGGDIKAMHEQRDMFAGDAEAIAQHYQNIIHPMQQAIYQSNIPLIAAVQGAATGAGNDLMAHCDIAIATPHARFSESFVNLGLISGDGGLWILPRKIGWGNARLMALTGDWFSAEQARQMGLIHTIVEADNLLPYCQQLAHQMAKHPLAAIRATRRLLRESQQQSFDQHLQACATVQGQLHHSESHQQRLSALLNK